MKSLKKKNKGTYGGGREREKKNKNGKTLAIESRDLGEGEEGIWVFFMLLFSTFLYACNFLFKMLAKDKFRAVYSIRWHLN